MCVLRGLGSALATGMARLGRSCGHRALLRGLCRARRPAAHTRTGGLLELFARGYGRCGTALIGCLHEHVDGDLRCGVAVCSAAPPGGPGSLVPFRWSLRCGQSCIFGPRWPRLQKSSLGQGPGPTPSFDRRTTPVGRVAPLASCNHRTRGGLHLGSSVLLAVSSLRPRGQPYGQEARIVPGRCCVGRGCTFERRESCCRSRASISRGLPASSGDRPVREGRVQCDCIDPRRKATSLCTRGQSRLLLHRAPGVWTCGEPRAKATGIGGRRAILGDSKVRGRLVRRRAVEHPAVTDRRRGYSAATG